MEGQFCVGAMPHRCIYASVSICVCLCSKIGPADTRAIYYMSQVEYGGGGAGESGGGQLCRYTALIGRICQIYDKWPG